MPEPEPPVVRCRLCGREIEPRAALWMATDDSAYTDAGIPLDLDPLCDDCILEIKVLDTYTQENPA